MNETQTLWQFMATHRQELLQQSLQHLGLTFASLTLAVFIGLPLGIFIAKRKKYATLILGVAGIMQTIPSIALLGFLIPVLGIGMKPAIAALFLYALLPIIRNTYTGIKGINPEIKEAAMGLGMTPAQILTAIELPLSLPVILAGIRTAAVINVGVATLAAYIAAGGLGEFIFGGIALNNANMILAGAIPAAMLALLLDGSFYLLQRIRFNKRTIRLALIVFAVLLTLFSFRFLPLGKQEMLAGFEPEFMGRQDGYLGLKKVYHFQLKTVVVSDAVMYSALREKKLDVIGGYSTDGRLKTYKLKTLEDDLHIFPPYYAAPMVSTETLHKNPGLDSVLNLLGDKINDSLMTLLNYKVDHLKESPQAVAKDFLKQLNLWKEPSAITTGTFRIGGKIFTEQYILANLYSMLIAGHTTLKPELKTGLGGTKICFDALVNRQIDMYPEYTGTGLLVLLQPSPFIVDSLGSHREKVYEFVKQSFQKQYNITWLNPIGFNNTYALMMRQEDAEERGIETISQLSQLK